MRRTDHDRLLHFGRRPTRSATFSDVLPVVLILALGSTVSTALMDSSHSTLFQGGHDRFGHPDYRSQTKFCYSCMSEDFLTHWPYMQEAYYAPMNFTDYCFSIPSRVQIGVQPCSDSVCVTIIEPKILAGQHIGNNIIRGCLTSVFKHAYKPPPAPMIVSDTSCSRLTAKKLLPPHMAARSSNRSIEMCWCVGQLCNDYPSVAVNTCRDKFSLLMLATTLSFIYYISR